MRTAIGLMLLYGLLLSSGCQSTSMAAGTPLKVTPSQTPEPVSTTQGESEMTPSLPTPADPGLQSLIEKTKEDLAQRLSSSVTQINLIEATEVEWSDSSLGCPQPGMDYLQVITPGYLIRLEAGGQEYEYHSNRDTYFVLCENSGPPGLLKP